MEDDSSGSRSGSASAGTERQPAVDIPKRPRIALACKTSKDKRLCCKSHKQCLRIEATTDEGEPCERCQRGGHECKYEASTKPRTRKDSNVSQRQTAMEQRLDKLESERAGSGFGSTDYGPSTLNVEPLMLQVAEQSSDKAPTDDTMTSNFFLNPADDSYSRLSPPPMTSNTQTSTTDHSEDLVTRGFLTDDTARKYWDLFHTRCAYRVGWSTDIHEYDKTRRLSPLLFAVACSVGAGALNETADALQCLSQARMMAQSKVFIDDLVNTPAALYDLRGLMMLCTYWNMPHLVPHIVSIAYHLGLHTTFAKLTHPSLRGQADEADLIYKGRIWLLIYIYSHLYSLFHFQPLLLFHKDDLILQQAAVLRSSRHSLTELDACFACHAHLMSLLAKAQSDLVSTEGEFNPEAWRKVAQHATTLTTWWEKWSSADQIPFDLKELALSFCLAQCLFIYRTFSSSYFLTAFHLSEMYIHSFAFSPVKDGHDIVKVAQRLESAMVACRSARALLETALDPTRGIPPLGLAIDFQLVGMGFATATVLSLALMLPGHFDIGAIRNLISRLFDSFYAENTSPYAKPVMKLVGKLDAIVIAMGTLTDNGSSAQREMDLLKEPQVLDEESRRLLESIAGDPAFHEGIVSCEPVRKNCAIDLTCLYYSTLGEPKKQAVEN